MTDLKDRVKDFKCLKISEEPQFIINNSEKSLEMISEIFQSDYKHGKSKKRKPYKKKSDSESRNKPTQEQQRQTDPLGIYQTK